MKKLVSLFLAACVLRGVAGCTKVDHAGPAGPAEDLSGYDPQWSMTYLDRHRAPIEKVVFAGDVVSDWADSVVREIADCQAQEVASARVSCTAEDILAEGGDLIVIANGVEAYLGGKSALAYGEELETLVKTVQEGSKAPVVITGLPYITANDADVDIAVGYNSVIRAVAMGTDGLYVNLFYAQGMRDWTLESDGRTLNALGNLLVGNGVMSVLLANCSCLDMGSEGPRFYTKLSLRAPSATRIATFVSTTDLAELKELLESGYIGADLSLLHILSDEDREAVYTKLLAADRNGIDSYLDADVLLNRLVMPYLLNAPSRQLPEGERLAYVAVGDSISYGIGANNPHTDGYVPRFADSLSEISGKEVKLINEAISGTRMSTEHKEGLYPAAKDTVQEYIVPHAPDILTIAYGTNDRTAGTTIADFISDYRGYLTEIMASCPDTMIIVCGLPYSRTQTSQVCSYREWNQAIKALAEEFGLIYCDCFDDMYGTSWLLADNVHPTNAGYRAMKNALIRTLNQFMDIYA